MEKNIKPNTAIVIGAGRLGSAIGKELNQQGFNVTMIDNRDNVLQRLSDEFSGYLIKGDATDLSVLESNDIKKVEKVIITTGNDNTNLFLAHVCYYIYNVPEIFIRLSDNTKSKLIKNTPIKAIYPFILSKNQFVDYLNENKESDLWEL